jgi:hypothetical protein
MLLLSIFVYFAAKTNFVLILLLFPLLLLYRQLKWWRLSRRQSGIAAGVFGLALLSLGFILLQPYGGLFDFISRLFITFVNNPATWIENQVPHNFISTFVAPYPRYNDMPVWLVGVWAAMLAVVAAVEERYITSRLIVWGSVSIFALNLLAIYYSFLAFKSSFINGVNSANDILGVQGRYTTPFYLLAAFIPASGWANLKLKKPLRLLVSVIVIVVLSNALLLFNTLYGIVYLKP